MRIGPSNVISANLLLALTLVALACAPVWSSECGESSRHQDRSRAASAIGRSLDFLSARAEEDDDEDDAPKKKKKKKSRSKKKKKKEPTSVAFEYVKSNLQEYLHADSVKFLKNGHVRVYFDFSKKNEDQEGIFTPKIETKVQNDFRWTVLREEGWSHRRRRRDVKDSEARGLRIGNKGTALLNCWFKDNVVAEVEYLPCISYSHRQKMALIFRSDKGKRAIGGNFGSQCVTLKGGTRPVFVGKAEEVPSHRSIDIKIETKDGVVKSSRNGKQKAEGKYRPRYMASGRIGFYWAGGVAGFFPELTITGELDSEKMLKVIRKSLKKRR